MQKIKSSLGNAGSRLRRAATGFQEKFPGLSKWILDALSRCREFCKARPRLSAGTGIILFLLIAGATIKGCGKGATDNGSLMYEVKRAPLTISVVSSGTIENKEKVVVRNEIEGAKATILWLVDEGKRVNKGDLLCELDSADFEDQLLDVQIQVGNSSSDVVRASETLAITRNQAEADIEKAELSLKFAKLALKKYKEGDYPQSLQTAKTDITIAQEELRRAEDRLAWSEKLWKEEFITRSEYEADELALRKKEIELEMAKKRLEVLEKYTHVVDVEKLESDVRQASLAVERVRRKAKADILKEEVDLSAKEVGLSRQEDRLAKVRERIERCRIIAPVDGLVVYATSVESGHWRRRSEPLSTGQTLDGREELIYLPTTGSMTVRFDVQEGSLSKIDTGIPAVITVDALPGRKLSAVVTKVSVLPDTGQSWLNPDLKVYNCEAEITSSTEGLRPGMSCTVEALFRQLDDVLFVPIQCVVRVNKKPTVYVKRFRGVKPTTVETGLDNNRMIHIVSGLEEGDEVLLAPPLAPAEKRSEVLKEDAVPVAPAGVKTPSAPQIGRPSGAERSGGEKRQGRPRAEGKRPAGTGGSSKRPADRTAGRAGK